MTAKLIKGTDIREEILKEIEADVKKTKKAKSDFQHIKCHPCPIERNRRKNLRKHENQDGSRQKNELSFNTRYLFKGQKKGDSDNQIEGNVEYFSIGHHLLNQPEQI